MHVTRGEIPYGGEKYGGEKYGGEKVISIVKSPFVGPSQIYFEIREDGIKCIQSKQTPQPSLLTI